MKLEEMKRIAEARTKGEWSIPTRSDNTDDIIRADGERICGSCCCGGFNKDEDGEFIAMAANNWDKLMAVVEAAKNFRDGPDDPKAMLLQAQKLGKALAALEKE